MVMRLALPISLLLVLLLVGCPDALSLSREQQQQGNVGNVNTDIDDDNRSANSVVKSEQNEVKLYVTTFNVNGQDPPEDLGDWLAFDPDTPPPDLVMIGLQEIVPLDNALSYLWFPCENEKKWLDLFAKKMPDYKLVKCDRMVGIWLGIYRRQRDPGTNSAELNLSKLLTTYVPTGRWGLFGNKGAVAMHFRLNGIPMCVVCAHLTAGQGKFAKRNQDYNDIYAHLEPWSNRKRHDVTIWFGDLNYRLNTTLLRNEVIGLVDSNQFGQLFPVDELALARQMDIFYDFREMEINFKPTYSYEPGTDIWENHGRNELPAWCDRILYHCQAETVELKQLEYKSVQNGV